jgi:glucokinase
LSILAIDFGGTRTRAALYSDDLRPLARDEIPTLAHDPTESVIERIMALVRRVAPDKDSITSIGICASGPQAYTGVILHANSLPPHWHNTPFAEPISRAFGGVPAYMENDANLAALAEYHLGAARGADPALYLTISTGIGGGAIIGGKLFTGFRGLAIEPGHQKFMHPDGKIYSLEQLACGRALADNALRKLAATSASSRLRSVDMVDGKAVGEAASQGDALALEVIQEAGRWLGLALVNLIHLFNPQVIVCGGSVAMLGDLMFDPARQIIEEYLIDPAFNIPDLIKLAELGDDVCLVGAALHAKEKQTAIC